jgi:hypothetical protein
VNLVCPQAIEPMNNNRNNRFFILVEFGLSKIVFFL